jgi:hypothetical protein
MLRFSRGLFSFPPEVRKFWKIHSRKEKTKKKRYSQRHGDFFFDSILANGRSAAGHRRAWRLLCRESLVVDVVPGLSKAGLRVRRRELREQPLHPVLPGVLRASSKRNSKQPNRAVLPEHQR